jgi:SH3 domain-containing YSC84-like protein 1
MPGVTKAAFIVGGEHGKGVMSCRAAGRWSAPVFMAFDKESFGAQIGAESIDLIVLVMNDRGVADFFANRFVSRALSRKS